MSRTGRGSVLHPKTNLRTRECGEVCDASTTASVTDIVSSTEPGAEAPATRHPHEPPGCSGFKEEWTSTAEQRS